jgi:hypothetical protein
LAIGPIVPQLLDKKPVMLGITGFLQEVVLTDDGDVCDGRGEHDGGQAGALCDDDGVYGPLEYEARSRPYEWRSSYGNGDDDVSAHGRKRWMR